MAATTKITIKDIQAMNTVAITRTVAAGASGVDPRTITAGIENGTIPSVRIGRRVLIPRVPFLALWGITDANEEADAGEVR